MPASPAGWAARGGASTMRPEVRLIIVQTKNIAVAPIPAYHSMRQPPVAIATGARIAAVS